DLELMPDGQILLGTFQNGLQLFNPATETFSIVGYDFSVQQFGAKDRVIRLPNNSVAELQPLDEHHFLATTYNGMVVIDWQKRQAFAYTDDNGLPNNEFNRLAAILNQHDQVFVGGINGFSRIPASAIRPKATGPIPIISRIFQFKKGGKEENSVLLDGRTNNSVVFPPNLLYFGFDLSLLDFDNPKVNTFQSWLEGYELNYGPPTTEAQLQYDLLPAGNYTLHVRGFTNDGEQSKEELILPIRVKQPWYYRTWFLVLSQLLLIGSGYLLYQGRIRRIQREAENKRKTDRQLAELELMILRQQLNPHFIFNALGAIQNFIQSEKSQIATEYLADFAKLMRMFLESSKQSFIFIRDELELIRLYTSLERLRFQNRFDVHFDIDPEIDQDMEDIPSLLLQPFVENAINHGLFHLKQGGLLSISMQAGEDDEIICTVTDNGIGRKASAKLQKKSYRKHKSRATQIVTERLDIFQQAGDTDLSIVTEDLYPEREYTGTKVTIRVRG
ncbi:MAG: histidine kinase, partial [Bacteroidota bacterium]